VADVAIYRIADFFFATFATFRKVQRDFFILKIALFPNPGTYFCLEPEKRLKTQNSGYFFLNPEKNLKI